VQRPARSQCHRNTAAQVTSASDGGPHLDGTQAHRLRKKPGPFGSAPLRRNIDTRSTSPLALASISPPGSSAAPNEVAACCVDDDNDDDDDAGPSTRAHACSSSNGSGQNL
jgi:hypothetical protein